MKVGLEGGEVIRNVGRQYPISCQVNLNCPLGSEYLRCYLQTQTDRSSDCGASLSSRC
jgi:hypothetical protein